MKIILQQNVLKLGKAGDIVEASDGYFRNFLQPRKLAVVATAGTLKKREEDLETLKKKAAAAHQVTVELAEKINALDTINISVKAGEGGKLYGKITNKEIAQELEKLVGTEIDKRLVRPVNGNPEQCWNCISQRLGCLPDVVVAIEILEIFS